MTLTHEEIGIIATAACLFLSEFLPFVDGVEGNGLLHILARVVIRLSLGRPNDVRVTATPAPDADTQKKM